MSRALLIVLGLGAGALLLRRATRSGGLEGIDRAKKGIMGSPFVVECVTDPIELKFHLEFLSGKKNVTATRLMTAQEVLEEATEAATTCTWRCIDEREVKVAQFRNRELPDNYAILARSAKGDGGWQMNWFDAQGPYGDSPRRTQCDALAELSSPYNFRGSKHTVEGEVMSNWYLEDWK